MKLYNTLTREKEEFKPIKEGEVSIYSCGPTVYNYAHIGNMRTYIFMDLLRRVLIYNGYKLKHVMNITDVGHLVSDADEGEDKLVKAAMEEKKSPWEIAEYYTKVFFNDIEALNIGRPEIIAKATDHIGEMIDFVKGLEEKGYGYETSDGIYFDVMKFKGYGKLSRIDLEDLMPGARIEVNQEKRHPADFALWKKAPKEHIMQWPSPWGMGYPGWHIECSAMGRKYLGDEFDIHTGGVDHIPIHHENEIAQTEALLGKPSAQRWLHGEFLLVDNGKMSKSLGNVYTISDLKAKGYEPLAFRYMCLNAHYRNKLNFTWEVLASAQVALDRLKAGALAHKLGNQKVDNETVEKFKREFDEAINDDLNIPMSMSVVWNIIRYPDKSPQLFDLLVKMDSILGLNLGDVKEEKDDEIELSPEIKALIEERQKARKEKNWKAADEIRDRLKAMGIILEDTPQGVKVRKE
ncbi:MAG TPA: cysteine--tRNA ligase [Clostridiaceae bacterium]|nr:cysteine--tRNA ligase [Clostridiaceae bacterium]